MTKQNMVAGTTPLTPATVTVPPGASGADAALFPVVGIGASAGGLEALTEFFRAMAPQSGMAFVVVTHLDANHKSAMTEILSHITTMVVGEVSDGTELQADHVYVIPPNTNMVVEGNRLRLAPRRETRGLHMPVDVFLRSLAIARNSQAVGVILSGTGTDGTLGLKAIKGEGGITFAQDHTAKHDGMPRSAFSAGCVDFVLSPPQIATELSRLGSHPYLSGGLQTSWGTFPTCPVSEASESINAATEQINAAVSTMDTDGLPRTDCHGVPHRQRTKPTSTRSCGSCPLRSVWTSRITSRRRCDGGSSDAWCSASTSRCTSTPNDCETILPSCRRSFTKC